MLNTKLKHVESDKEYEDLLTENENVMLCCGRMGPMCMPVYNVMDGLQSDYPHVCFCDVDFDGPAVHNVRSLPEVKTFMGLPFTIYYKNGKVVDATTSIQNEKQVTDILDRLFTNAA